jgi:hypothetical protein
LVIGSGCCSAPVFASSASVFIRMEQPGRRKIGHAPAAGVHTLQRIQTDPPRSFADHGAACGGAPLRRGRLLLEGIRMEAAWRFQLPQQR